MRLSVTLAGHGYSFRDVREVMGKANEEKSGDRLAGVAAESPQERVAARIVLSSSAVQANAENILPVIHEGLTGAGIRVSDPFFVRYGRVATEDQIGEATGAEVVCVLLGERPGLVTAESMSAYRAYRPTVGMEEPFGKAQGGRE